MLCFAFITNGNGGTVKELALLPERADILLLLHEGHEQVKDRRRRKQQRIDSSLIQGGLQTASSSLKVWFGLVFLCGKILNADL